MEKCNSYRPKVSGKYRAFFLLAAAAVALAFFELSIARQCAKRGDAFLGAGMYGQAVRHYRKTIILARRFTDAYNSMAYAYEKMGQIDKAISTYEHSFRWDPENDAGYTYLGQLYFVNKKMIKKAKECFKKAVELNPRNREAYIWLGICYEKSGERDKAISLYREMLKVFPDDGLAKDNLKKLGKD